MQKLLVRATVQLPPDALGRSVPVGGSLYVDADDPYVATQLACGHLIPVGAIPKLEPPPTEK